MTAKHRSDGVRSARSATVRRVVRKLAAVPVALLVIQFAVVVLAGRASADDLATANTILTVANGTAQPLTVSGGVTVNYPSEVGDYTDPPWATIRQDSICDSNSTCVAGMNAVPGPFPAIINSVDPGETWRAQGNLFGSLDINELYAIGTTRWTLKLAVWNAGEAGIAADRTGSYAQCEIRNPAGVVTFSSGDGVSHPGVSGPFACTATQSGPGYWRAAHVTLNTYSATGAALPGWSSLEVDHQLDASSGLVPDLLNRDCLSGNPANCAYDDTAGGQPQTVADPAAVGQLRLVNCNPPSTSSWAGTAVASETQTVSHSVSNSWSATEELGVGIGEFLNTAVSANVGGSTSTTTSVSSTTQLNVAPGTYQQASDSSSESHYSGAVSFSIGSDHWIVDHADVDIPKGDDTLAPRSNPVDPADCPGVATQVALTSSPGSPVAGTAVTYRATVSSARSGDSAPGTGQGAVEYTDNGANVAGCGNVSIDATGSATCVYTAPADGRLHAVRAYYRGFTGTLSGTSYSWSPSSRFAAVAPTAAQAVPTTAVVTVVPASSGQGQQLLAACTAASASCAPTGGGEVATYTPYSNVGNTVIECASTGTAQATHTSSVTNDSSNTVGAGAELTIDIGVKLTTVVGYSHGWGTSTADSQSVTITAGSDYAVTLQQKHLDPSGTMSATAVFIENGQVYVLDGVPTADPVPADMAANPVMVERAVTAPALPSSCPGNDTSTSASGPATAVAGVSTNLTASVQAPVGTVVNPTGSVVFTQGSTVLCTATLSPAAGSDVQSTGTCATTALTGGQQTVTATYAGNIGAYTSSTFHGSSGSYQLSVTPAATAISISGGTVSGPNSWALDAGVPNTVSVSVSALNETPTGAVTLLDGTTVVCANLIPDHNGIASCTWTPQGGGNHVLIASYAGDVNTAAASTPVTVYARTASVLAVSTTLQGAGSLSTVLVSMPNDAPVPTGQVVFAEGATTLCSQPWADFNLGNYGMVAVCQVAFAAGPHTVTVSYAGDGQHARASQTVTFTIAKAPVAITLSGGGTACLRRLGARGRHRQHRARDGDRASNETPTGTVTLTDATATGTATACANLSLDPSGTATCVWNPQGAGNHVLTANYSGDANTSIASTGPVTVNARTVSALTVSTAAGNVAGTRTTLNATMPGTATPAGTVSFTDGTTTLCTTSWGNYNAGGLNGGMLATCTVALTGGPHTVTVSYAGDSNYTPGSGSASFTEAPATTSVALSGGTPLSTGGWQLTAAVPNTLKILVSAANETPTGTVTLTDGASTACANLRVDNNGTATCTWTPQGTGSHPLTATYSGDTNTSTASTGAVPATAFAAPPSTLAVTMTAAPAGLPSTIEVTTPSYGLVPTGVLAFSEGPTTLCAPTWSALLLPPFGITIGGLADCTVAFAPGPHTVTVSYAGDTLHAAATQNVTFTVSADTTTTALTQTLSSTTFSTDDVLTATVTSPAKGLAPSGTVTFYDGTSPLDCGGRVSASTRAVSCTIDKIAVGVHNYYAVYQGEHLLRGLHLQHRDRNDQPRPHHHHRVRDVRPYPGPEHPHHPHRDHDHDRVTRSVHGPRHVHRGRLDPLHRHQLAYQQHRDRPNRHR